MEKTIYSPLQLKELFHLEFLRWFSRKTKTNSYVLKGGTNLRFFFNSFRYSEDMDLDAQGIDVHILKDIVMNILVQQSFQDLLKPFGVDKIVGPDINRAKQTETTQRFKVHLITFAGEDLFTKIEFSRRGFRGKAVVQSVSDHILRTYKLPPLLVPHYNAYSAAAQKIGALSDRTLIQARDIFDLYILSSQCEPSMAKETDISNVKLTRAYKNIFEVSFEQFKDTVVTYLSPEDRPVYNLPSSWDEIKLKAANFIEEMRNLK
jgi:predicted nucleotidyltransferase component of viral defense system